MWFCHLEYSPVSFTKGSGDALGSVADADDLASCTDEAGCGGLWLDDFAGLHPVTGLHTPELSSGHRKTSMGPLVLFREIWYPYAAKCSERNVWLDTQVLSKSLHISSAIVTSLGSATVICVSDGARITMTIWSGGSTVLRRSWHLTYPNVARC